MTAHPVDEAAVHAAAGQAPRHVQRVHARVGGDHLLLNLQLVGRGQPSACRHRPLDGCAGSCRSTAVSGMLCPACAGVDLTAMKLPRSPLSGNLLLDPARRVQGVQAQTTTPPPLLPTGWPRFLCSILNAQRAQRTDGHSILGRGGRGHGGVQARPPKIAGRHEGEEVGVCVAELVKALQGTQQGRSSHLSAHSRRIEFNKFCWVRRVASSALTGTLQPAVG